jgi:hypothetical protein
MRPIFVKGREEESAEPMSFFAGSLTYLDFERE